MGGSAAQASGKAAKSSRRWNGDDDELRKINEVQAWLESRGGEMAALLEDLVGIDTDNPPGHRLGRCGRLLRHAMTGFGFSPERIELPRRHELEEPCIVRGSVGSGVQTLYFHGHFDVVPRAAPGPVSTAESERHDRRPRHPRHEGRPDQHALRRRCRPEVHLLGDGRIVFHFVCDEENGSIAGSGHLREAGMIDPSAVAMVTAEPTGGVVWGCQPGRHHTASRRAGTVVGGGVGRASGSTRQVTSPGIRSGSRLVARIRS